MQWKTFHCKSSCIKLIIPLSVYSTRYNTGTIEQKVSDPKASDRFAPPAMVSSVLLLWTLCCHFSLSFLIERLQKSLIFILAHRVSSSRRLRSLVGVLSLFHQMVTSGLWLIAWLRSGWSRKWPQRVLGISNNPWRCRLPAAAILLWNLLC